MFMGFGNVTFFSSLFGQTIALTVVDDFFVEETSISFSFLEPFHNGFLVPNYLLMMFSFTEFLDQGAFLIPNIYRET